MKPNKKELKKYAAVTRFLMAAVICAAAFFTSLQAQEIFYVATNGNDDNPGTPAQPLKTFPGAKAKVRTVRDGSGDITVYFRGGSYVFDTTVVLGPQDSGTTNQTITYAAYPGETPVFSSLVRVTGWSTYQAGIMVAPLPGGVSHVRYLHDAGENWMERSSTAFFRPAIQSPSGGSESEHWEPGSQDNKTYTLYPGSFNMPDPSKGSQYDLRVHMTAWHAQVLPISGITPGSRRIDLATSSHYPLYNGIDDLLTECWVLNSIAGIAGPGQWACIDSKIYLWPVSGTSDIYIPSLRELIRIDAGGDGNTWTGTPVRYIHFDGITFTGCDYRPMAQNDVCAQHDWQMVDVPEGLLRFRNAADCNVGNCTFTKSGCDGVRLDRHCQNIAIDNCEFSFLGKGGVVLTGRGPGYGDVNKNNTITNSHFNSTSRIKWDAAAVHIDQSSSNLVKQNYFEDLPLSAIIVSGCRESNLAEAEADGVINRDFHWSEVRPDLIENPWGASAEFYDHDNVVEENTFRAVHAGRSELVPAVSDEAPGFTNGMIYTTGRKKGATDTIRKNYFFDVSALPTYSHTWVVLGDGHEDYLDFHQNMAYNLQQAGGFEETPFMSNNCNVSGGCRAFANVKLNSPYSSMECDICTGTSYGGNIDFDTGNPSGSAAYLAQYIEMYRLLCTRGLPGPKPLPGAEDIKTNLADVITGYGGTLPDCSSPSQFTLSTGVTGLGGITVSPSGGTYDAGTQVTLTANPSTGWQFDSWSGDLSGSSNPAVIVMNSDKSVTAIFTRGSSQTATISLNRDELFFGATPTGTATDSQLLTIANTGGGTLNWTAACDRFWLSCTPSSGTGAGTVSVSVNAAGLSTGIHTGTLTVSAPNALNSPQTLSVTLTVYDPAQLSGPFGHFATPVEGSAAAGSIPVTGWALDDIGIESVKLYRGSAGALTYIGDAVLVEGARPDVEQAYPDYPMNYKAGWGYMLLTNFFPDGGNGTFTLHAAAVDKDGRQATLGTKTIILNNAGAVKPFGAIDTPAQGGTASGGGFDNWGWVLTPPPNSIPANGSTIDVLVDGVVLGHPTYNNYREDIASFFPGYSNSNGAAGYFELDTTAYENGVHTIQWTAVDNAGNSDGIGSRYFSIQNPGSSRARSRAAATNIVFDLSEIDTLPAAHPEPYRVEIRELEPLNIPLLSASMGPKSGADTGTVGLDTRYKIIAGYMVSGRKRYPLPIGSTVKDGFFLWSPGPGFFGRYRLEFVLEDQRGRLSKREIEITIRPH